MTTSPPYKYTLSYIIITGIPAILCTVLYNYCNDNVTVIQETTFYIFVSPFCNLPNVNSSMHSSTGSGPPLLLMEVEAYCHNPVGYR